MKWESKGKKKKYSISRLFKSFGYAIRGIGSAFKTEQNLLIELIGLIINIILIWYLKLNSIETCIIILVCTVIISLEMVNTSIEYTVDMAMPNMHPLAKNSKDTASGAVLVASLGAIVIGIIIYIPKIIALFS